MVGETNNAIRFSPRPLPDAAGVDSGRDGPLASLKRKISSRLARHLPLERRRFVDPRPMVSFTFDDAAVSAGEIGAARLEALGGRGTYYIASGLVGHNEAGYPLIGRGGVRELHRRGHEIALHGHDHRPAGAFTAQGFLDDLRRNREWLQALDEDIRPVNFAYPYGLADFARKRQLYSFVESSRTVAPGLVLGNFDPQFLRCVELADRRLTPEGLDAYLDAVVRSNGWLIFCSHDIAERPNLYGCTPSLFQRALDGVAARGVEIVTVADAMRRSRPVGRAAHSPTVATGSQRS